MLNVALKACWAALATYRKHSIILKWKVSYAAILAKNECIFKENFAVKLTGYGWIWKGKALTIAALLKISTITNITVMNMWKCLVLFLLQHPEQVNI